MKTSKILTCTTKFRFTLNVLSTNKFYVTFGLCYAEIILRKHASNILMLDVS